MEDHIPQGSEVVFVQDAGISLKSDFSHLFASWGGFFMLIVVWAGIKGAFGLLYFLGGTVVSAILAALLSIFGMYSVVAEIRFRPMLMELSSTIFRATRRGKHITIPYDLCYVKETEYWRFRKIHMLQFRIGKKFKCLITDVSFGGSYQQIKMELAKRLPEEHLDLRVMPPRSTGTLSS